MLALNTAKKVEQDVQHHVVDANLKAVSFVDSEAEPLVVGGLASSKRPTLTFRDPGLEEPAMLEPGARTVTFMPSQIGAPDQVSISYTATPFRLMRYDIQLILGKLSFAVGVMRPWRLGADADPYDEMYPNGRNLMSIGLHAILVAMQSVSMCSIFLT
jgi:hypothetical protein